MDLCGYLIYGSPEGRWGFFETIYFWPVAVWTSGEVVFIEAPKGQIGSLRDRILWTWRQGGLGKLKQPVIAVTGLNRFVLLELFCGAGIFLGSKFVLGSVYDVGDMYVVECGDALGSVIGFGE